MDFEEEVNIIGDISNQSLPSNFGNVNSQSQRLFDGPIAKPYCLYIDSIYKTLEESRKEFRESEGHIISENSISDESGWTGKEKHLLERGIETYGRIEGSLAQLIVSKNPSEIKYYLDTFHNELHPIHSAKYSTSEVDENKTGLGTAVINSEIPCTSELISKKILFIGGQEDVVVNIKNVNKVEMNNTTTKQTANGNIDILYNIHDITVKRKNSLSKIKFVKTKFSSVNNVMPIRTGVLLNEGEEIINIKQDQSCASDSDIEVDIENNDELHINERKIEEYLVLDCHHDQNRNIQKKSVENLTFNNSVCIPSDIRKHLSNVLNDILLPDVDQDLMDQLSSLNIPKTEFKLRMDLITDLEKVVNHDFFSVSSRSVKSADLYLRLRYHIISLWMRKKPHYVTKTDVGKNLNVSISKNTLNRIHNSLEQIGAINFGCRRVRYLRPLFKLLRSPEFPCGIKSIQSRRIRKKFVNNGQGGCTVSHGAHGEVINTTVVNEDPVPIKMKTLRKQPIYLINCKPFTQSYNYTVKLHISTLLLMDFHAHSSLSEVMGLIGGIWYGHMKTLVISHYEPCKNVASSTTHCDMCPVSQANSADIIHNKEMDLLGWFHSHPTFPPEPSQQDLDTQKSLQQWIGNNKPCVGVILTPFRKPYFPAPSDYRCMIVEKLQGDDMHLPYKFDVDVLYDNFDIDEFLGNILKIFHFNNSNGDLENDRKMKINFRKPYLFDSSITYLDKFITSTKVTLEKYLLNENISQEIITGIQRVFTNETC